MAERTPEEVLSGLLQVSVGGIVKAVPTLKIEHVAEWAAMLSAAGEPKPIDDWTSQDVAALSGQTAERLLDLAVAYDRTAALGGREWLAKNADPQQLHAAVTQMVGNAFPLADDPAALLGLMLIQSAAASKSPTTNGASPRGASRRPRSARSSTRSS